LVPLASCPSGSGATPAASTTATASHAAVASASDSIAVFFQQEPT
jgi:hypothetical protein